VNDPPTFNVGAINIATDEDSATTVAHWVDSMSPGPPDEADQMPLALSITAVSEPALFAAGPQLDSDGNLTYTPEPNAHGMVTVPFTLKDSGAPGAAGLDSATKTFLIVIDKPYPLHNTLNGFDTNGDGHISPIDALGIINFINEFGSQAVI